MERELFAYCRSDKRVLQMKCSRLHSYFKEIADREERAKRRNLELLRDVECIENSMKKYQPNTDLLLQQKDQVKNMILKCMDATKIISHDDETDAAKVKGMQCQDMSFTDGAKTPTELSVIGLQRAASSEHILYSSAKSRVQIHEHLLKDSRPGLKGIVSNQAYLSDGISSSNDPPDGFNLSDKLERTTAMLPTVCTFTLNAQNGPSLSNEHKPSPPLTLTAAEGKPSLCSTGPMGVENPIVEKMEPKESTTQAPEIEEERIVIPENTAGSSLSSEMNLSASQSSALSISLTQSELEEDLPESDAADKHDLNKNTDCHSEFSKSSLHSEQSGRSLDGDTKERSLSQKRLFKLLDTIEGLPLAVQTRVYSNPSINTKELQRLISLCNDSGDLNGEDPKAYGAVVLHELQRLSWSTVKGCLLPPDLVNAHQSCTSPEEISARLLPGAAQLWDRWFKHALLLKESSVLSTEHLVQLFTPLLLERHATYGHQAKVLLRTLLSWSSEECPSAEDESDVSSFGPDPLPTAGAVRPLQKQYTPELQSSEEDSQDESPVESVPIRESKAYLLLKESAMQKRILNSNRKDDDDDDQKHDDDEDDLSGTHDDHEEDLGWEKRSLHQDPYPRMEEANSKASSALQSKAAFWGESDDSNSEIEAALRPQPFSANNVDTADSY